MELHCGSVDLSCMESDLQWDLLSVNCGSVNLWLFVNHLTLSIKKSNVILMSEAKK